MIACGRRLNLLKRYCLFVTMRPFFRLCGYVSVVMVKRVTVGGYVAGVCVFCLLITFICCNQLGGLKLPI